MSKLLEIIRQHETQTVETLIFCYYYLSFSGNFCVSFPLGISYNIEKVPNSAVTASSNWDSGPHMSYHGRLHEPAMTGSVGSWSAR